jgi:signal transduction histidine kinase
MSTQNMIADARSDTPAFFGGSRGNTAPNKSHVVQFYEDENNLCDTVAGFLADGLAGGHPVVVIATDAHRAALSSRLSSSGLDFGQACRTGQLSFHDAHSALSTFMSGDMPDEHLFKNSIGSIIDTSRDGRAPATTVRAYGEMVDVLWREGNRAAAIRLEELWNDLAATHSFSLLCAYAMANFYKEGHSQEFLDICKNHTHVIPAESYTQSMDENARAREISRLQQRARALENEIEHRKTLEGALRDSLAERLIAEEALRQAKQEAERANRTKSDFLAVMSHELRTPLNAIIGYQDLLDQEVGGPITSDQRAFLRRIGSGANQLLRLIDQILSLSRIEAGKELLHIEPVDVVALAAETSAFIEPSTKRKGLMMSLHVPDGPIVLNTDPGKLRQILLNLLSNAVKFTDEGGIRLHVRLQDENVYFEVGDTGLGIRTADQARIFEPFVQVDNSSTRGHGGTGLGLPVSRDLARLMGGDITVMSTPGLGSIFTLRLPAELYEDDGIISASE